METIQKPINGWMDKQNVLYTYEGILFSHKREWSTDTCYNMDELWNYYVKWKKIQKLKRYILLDSIYMKCPE